MVLPPHRVYNQSMLLALRRIREIGCYNGCIREIYLLKLLSSGKSHSSVITACPKNPVRRSSMVDVVRRFRGAEGIPVVK